MKCADHDYIEIACLYRNELKIKTISQQQFQGTAYDTRYNEQKRQCLCLYISNQIIEIELSHIRKIWALTNNPYFTYLVV